MDRTKIDNETIIAGDRNAHLCRYFLDGNDLSAIVIEARQIEGSMLALIVDHDNKAIPTADGSDLCTVRLYGDVEVFIESG